MNIENLIAQADANGWDFFDQQLSAGQRKSSLSVEQLARAEKLSLDAARMAANHPELLAYLVEITLERVSFTSALGLPMDAAYGHGCHREGQNAIVFTLLKMIAQGRKEQQPTERGAA